MNLILITAIALTIIFPAYMVLTDRKVGTSYSISDSWYSWKKVKKEWAFIIFLLLISLGLFLVVEEGNWKHLASPWLLIGGASTNWLIGLYANFKQGWRESMYHNIFSVATFALVHIAFYIEGIKFPLESFLLMAAVIAPIKIAQKTTVIEVIGIALAIMGVYYI